MKRNTFLPGFVVLVLLGVTAALLVEIKNNRRLGEPGVRTRPLAGAKPGSKNLEVLLPESVTGWGSMILTQAQIVVDALPSDTSFGQRVYKAEDGLQVLANVVLMGTDRTSIHQPEICLPGQGWQIDRDASRADTIHVEKPFAYELPVTRLVASLHTTDTNGQPVVIRCNYVYWFVDADSYTGNKDDFKWSMMWSVLRTGTLDRWAYIAFFSYGIQGQEDAVYDRTKKLIAETVPEFQLVPRTGKK